MTERGTANQDSLLAGVSAHYPEKTHYLGQVFNDTTNSYKLIWFLAILSLFRRTEAHTMPFADIFTEMAVLAWHPVCLYRLSLGRQDKLQDAIRDIQHQSQLPQNAAPDAIRNVLASSSCVQLDFIKNYVPARFLSPWFAEELRGERDSKRNGQIEDLSRQSQRTSQACPYYFGAGSIEWNESWRAFLIENMGVVESFAEHHLALYLQARNPNVPGVVNKLRAPIERQLSTARKFWRFIRANFEKSGQAHQFRDIYSENPLGDNFAIDHFLPWSFTVHDLLWNLTPVEPTTNSKKGDAVPDLALYIPRLARLHFCAIGFARSQPRLLEDYSDCFKQDPPSLLALGEEGFASKYREVFVPQAQIAMNQGFQSGWKYRN